MSHPELNDKWDEEKNGSMKLYAPESSPTPVWWKCLDKPCHHWKRTITEVIRQKSNNCPYCSGKRLCSCRCNSLDKTHPILIDEWDVKKNSSITLFTKNSSQLVHWVCRKNKKHLWSAIIYKRAIQNQGCPICPISKLETRMEESLIRNKISYEKQKRINDCKNKKCLPYDFYFQFQNKNIRVELQGQQHFEMNDYFYQNNLEKFIEKIRMDNIKSLSSYRAGDSYLAVSYLCIDEIQSCLNQYLDLIKDESIKQLFSFYLTNTLSIHLILTKNNCFNILCNKKFNNHFPNNVLHIFEIYRYQLLSLQNNVDFPLNFEFCNLCNQYYLILDMHYLTKHHKKNITKKLKDLQCDDPNIWYLTNNGIPIYIC